MSFASLGLVPELLRAVESAGYETPTPIQSQAIPIALEGRDLFGCAQTGTGKTAGFTLPMLQRLRQGRVGVLRALVLTPTRELAAQVADSIRTYGKYMPLRSAVVFGGVGMEPQIKQLHRGVDILVATPGRLLDHLGRGTVNLSRVEILVLDEADRMLDMGFIHDVRRILQALPAKRQTLFFSATMPQAIEELAAETLNDPAFIEVGRRSSTTEGVRQVAIPVDREQKRQLLFHLLREGKMGQVIVFTRTKHGADRLAEQLDRGGWKVTALHSNKSQQARTKALQSFRNGAVQIMVATDIAARGIDVEGVSHVVNYDMPNVAEDYVHRIGRTARASATGDAVSFVESDGWGLVREIERLTGVAITREDVPGFEPRVPVGVAAAAPGRGSQDGRPAEYGRGRPQRGYGGPGYFGDAGRQSGPGRPGGPGGPGGGRRRFGRSSVAGAAR